MNGLRLFVALLLGVLALPPAAAAQDPTTTQDPRIAVADLADRLLPLTRAELKVEADGWLGQVRATAQELADRQVRQRTAAPDQQAALATEIASLRAERDRRLERLEAAVAAFAEKGGSTDDVDVYRKYAAAVGGVQLDVTDAGALWTTVVGWLQSPDGGLRLLRNVIFFLLTLLAFRLLSRLAGSLCSGALGRFRHASDLLREFLVNSTRRVIMFIGVVVALSMLDVEIGPFLAAIGAAGFVIGFALQGTLSNFAAGVMILLYRPYDIGQFVTVAGVQGTVEAMTLVSTSVRTGDNQLVIVPNSSIWGGVITNAHGKDTRRVDLKFGVSYSDDLAKAEAVLRQVVAVHPLVLKDPAPVIKVHELADSSVNFIVRPWVKTADYWNVYWDLIRQVKEAFDREGISIPFPQRDVHLHQVAQA